jgi:hypothetical protein
MRVVSTCGLLSVLLAAVAASTPAAASTANGPRLGLVDQRPLIVRGTGFIAGERVVVRLAAGRAWTRSAVARSTGAFSVRFAASLTDCQRFTVRAVGDLGSHARLHSGIRTYCSPPDPSVTAVSGLQH